MGSYTEEQLNQFDSIVNMLLVDIYTKIVKDKQICLKKINLKDKSHLLFLKLCFLARDMFGLKIYVEDNFFKVGMLNWKIHKKYDKVTYTGNTLGGSTSVSDFLNDEKAKLIHLTNDSAIFEKIFDCYYGKEFQ